MQSLLHEYVITLYFSQVIFAGMIMSISVQHSVHFLTTLIHEMLSYSVCFHIEMLNHSLSAVYEWPSLILMLLFLAGRECEGSTVAVDRAPADGGPWRRSRSRSVWPSVPVSPSPAPPQPPPPPPPAPYHTPPADSRLCLRYQSMEESQTGRPFR